MVFIFNAVQLWQEILWRSSQLKKGWTDCVDLQKVGPSDI